MISCECIQRHALVVRVLIIVVKRKILASFAADDFNAIN